MMSSDRGLCRSASVDLPPFCFGIASGERAGSVSITGGTGRPRAPLSPANRIHDDVRRDLGSNLHIHIIILQISLEGASMPPRFMMHEVHLFSV